MRRMLAAVAPPPVVKPSSGKWSVSLSSLILLQRTACSQSSICMIHTMCCPCPPCSCTDCPACCCVTQATQPQAVTASQSPGNATAVLLPYLQNSYRSRHQFTSALKWNATIAARAQAFSNK